MPRIETILSQSDYIAWQSFCLTQKKISAKLLREFIQHSIHSGFTPAESHHIKNLKSKRITVSFTQSEWEAIVNKVTMEGYKNPTHWLRSLVMNVLHQEPVLTDTEILALDKLSYQLWGIGHNLNQITRALNINHNDTNLLKIEMIQSLQKLNLETRQALTSLVVKNKNRWHKTHQKSKQAFVTS